MVAVADPVDPVDLLTGEVQQILRRRGLDPAADADAVARAVDEAMADYEGRSLAGAAPLLLDPSEARGQVLDAVCGYGPLQRLLDDPEVEEIWINERLTAG